MEEFQQSLLHSAWSLFQSVPPRHLWFGADYGSAVRHHKSEAEYCRAKGLLASRLSSLKALYSPPPPLFLSSPAGYVSLHHKIYVLLFLILVSFPFSLSFSLPLSHTHMVLSHGMHACTHIRAQSLTDTLNWKITSALLTLLFFNCVHNQINDDTLSGKLVFKTQNAYICQLTSSLSLFGYSTHSVCACLVTHSGHI